MDLPELQKCEINMGLRNLERGTTFFIGTSPDSDLYELNSFEI
jgi:hypothetical protein